MPPAGRKSGERTGGPRFFPSSERAPACRRPAHARAQKWGKSEVELCWSTAPLRFEAKNSVEQCSSTWSGKKWGKFWPMRCSSTWSGKCARALLTDRVPKYLARSKMRENVASEVAGIYLAMEHNRKELARAERRAGNAADGKECRRLKQRRCAEREGAARFAPCFCPNHYSLALSFYAEVHLRAENGRNLARRVPRGTDESGFWPISRFEMSPGVKGRRREWRGGMVQ